MRGDLLAALDHHFRGLDQRRADEHHRARTAGAAAEGHAVAVALHQADAVERNAEHVGQHLREGRGVALAVIERAGDDGDRAVFLEVDAAHFLAGRGGHFEIAADAEAAQLAVLLAVALALLEAGIVGELQRLLEHAEEIAAVIGHAGGGA